MGNVLTVGDGDFSFSVGLRRRQLEREEEVGTTGGKRRKTESHGEGGRGEGQQSEVCKESVTCTSYESREDILRYYPPDTIKTHAAELGESNVVYSVDGTKLSSHSEIKGNIYDSVVWNFPCTAEGGGGTDRTGRWTGTRTC